MATATQSDKMNGQAIAARSEAVKILISKHSDEWTKLLAEERTKRGLSATAGGESTKALEDRAAKLRAKLEKAEQELKERGVSA